MGRTHNMGLQRLKKVIGRIIQEDYLDLEDKLVEIGVLIYEFQKGILSNAKEKKLRQYIGGATEDIKEVIAEWLVSHGLIDLIEELGLDYTDYTELFSDGASEIMEDITSETVSDGNFYDYGDKILKQINNLMGGEEYFGNPCCDEETLKEFIENHLDSETTEDKEEGDYEVYYIDFDLDDFISFLLDCKRNQVMSSGGEFYNIAESMVEQIKTIEEDLDVAKTEDLIQEFDILKDLNHTNGSLLGDYRSVNFDDINQRVEDRVRGNA